MLKAHLSDYIQKVEREEGLRVTRYGMSIARSMHIKRSSAGDPARERRLEVMETARLIRPDRREPSS